MATFNFYMRGEFRKINLKRGRQKEFTSGGRTEEGYDYVHYLFIHEGNGVRLEIERTASDCDGRLDVSSELFCPLSKLASRETPSGVRTPDWQRVEERQRDYAAEAMGY
jgi:hypothetical protein